MTGVSRRVRLLDCYVFFSFGKRIEDFKIQRLVRGNQEVDLWIDDVMISLSGRIFYFSVLNRYIKIYSKNSYDFIR